ncbi:unnamed protein product [Gadus morhua 'NCC']
MQSESGPTLTDGSRKPPTKSCVCGNNMSGVDSNSACLGLEHAMAALASPATCDHCSRFSHKTRKRRLNKQAKLFAEDPVMGATDPPLPELAGAVSMDLHEARAAVRLKMESPESLVETITSRYEGKRLPKAKASTSLLLPA